MKNVAVIPLRKEIEADREISRRIKEFRCPLNSVFLIAQIGKNYAIEEENRISGAELLELAFAKLRAVQSLIGGKLVLIERDASRAKLLDFYQANGFKSWSSRHSESDGIDYDQMLCVLNAPASGRGG